MTDQQAFCTASPVLEDLGQYCAENSLDELKRCLSAQGMVASAAARTNRSRKRPPRSPP